MPGAARTGRIDEAREHLAAAARPLESMGMRYWLAAAQAAGAVLESRGPSRTIRTP